MNIIGAIVLACLSLMAASGANIEPRVLSSKLSPDVMYPFQGMVLIDDIYACMANLITPSQLLTVASCVRHVVAMKKRPPKVKVRLGSIDKKLGKSYHVKRISCHLNFLKRNDDMYLHDLSVIHLWRPAELNDEVRPIMFPGPNQRVPEKVVVLFSMLYRKYKRAESLEPMLLRIIANTQTNTQCQSAFPAQRLIKKQMCIDIADDFIFGPVDMGGIMIDTSESTILGLGSSGCSRNGCSGIPKIFTKISEYVPYILEELSYGTPQYAPINPGPYINFV